MTESDFALETAEQAYAIAFTKRFWENDTQLFIKRWKENNDLLLTMALWLRANHEQSRRSDDRLIKSRES